MSTDGGSTRRQALGAGAAALALAACARGGPPPPSAFEGLIGSLSESAIADAPEAAVARGAPPTISPDAQRFGLDTRSPLGEELRRTALLRWSAQLLGFDPEAITDNERVTRAALLARLTAAQACADAPFGRLDLFTGFRPYSLAPGLAAFETAPPLLAAMPAATIDDAEAVIERFSRLPTAVRDELASARADAKAGAGLPDAALARLAAAAQAELALPGGRAAEAARAALRQAAKLGPVDSRFPYAVERISADYGRALAETLAALPSLRAPSPVGLSSLPNGRALYAACLSLALGEAADPQATLDQLQMARGDLTARLDMALRALGLAQGAPEERLAAVLLDPAAALVGADGATATLLAEAEAVARVAQAEAGRLYQAPPKSWPRFRALPQAAAPLTYAAAPLDGARPAEALLAAGPQSAPSRLDLARLVASVWLGRHAPAARTAANPGVPMIRRLIEIAGFSEGHALYAETLAEDAGMFDDAPFARLGRLRAQMVALASAQADLDIHWLGVAPAAAAEAFARATAAAPTVATSVIDAILIRPGRAAAAHLGQAQIIATREKARSRLGARFDIRVFHDLATREGELPLATLAELAARM